MYDYDPINNFDEAVTFHVHNAGTDAGELFYYLEDHENNPIIDLHLSPLYPVSEQIEVRRMFDYDEVDELRSDPPTPDEVRTLLTLRDPTMSGSPMYTVKEDDNKIEFSDDPADYIWKQGIHHNRGGDIQLNVWNSELDTTVISRVSDASKAKMIWTVGTKVTARSLNIQTEQVLKLAQELRTIELNPSFFNNSLGVVNGVCKLDGNGVIPLKNIPIEIGGQGFLYVDLSTYTISDLGNVSADGSIINFNLSGEEVSLDLDAPREGEVLTFTNVASWHEDWDGEEIYNQWIPRIPLGGVIDLSEAPHLGTLIWEDSPYAVGRMEWTLRRIGMNDLSNVSAPSPDLELGNILFYNEATDTWVPSVNELYTGILLDIFATALITVQGDADIEDFHGDWFEITDSLGVSQRYTFDTASTSWGATIGLQNLSIEDVSQRIVDSIHVHHETLDIKPKTGCPPKDEWGNYPVILTQKTTGEDGNTPITSSVSSPESLTISDSFTGGEDGNYYDNSLTPEHILVWDMENSRWKASLRPDITYEVFDLEENNLDSLADVHYLVGGDGNAARVPGDVLAWFTNDAQQGRWRDQSLDTWDINNWWAGTNSDSVQPGDAMYSGGRKHATLWHYYSTGWVPYWDKALPQQDDYDPALGGYGDPDLPEQFRGAFHVGPPMAGGRNPVTEEAHIIFEDALANQVLKWKVESIKDLTNDNTFPGWNMDDDTSHWEMGRLNLNHLGDVYARKYDFMTHPHGGGTSYKPEANAILVFWDSDAYDENDPNTGPPIDAWIVREGVDLGETYAGDYDSYSTTHTFDMKIKDAHIGYGPGDSFAGIWMDMYRFSYAKSRLMAWTLLHNGKATSRVRLFKTDYDDWRDGILNDITDNTSSSQNSSTRIIGGGQYSGQGFQRKVRDSSSSNFYLSGDVLMGSDESPIFRKDDILVCELENFNATNDHNTNLLTLILDWNILAV